MRRQRALRASSAQLCIFCASRFGLEPGLAHIPRRNLSTTGSIAPSAAPAIDNGESSPPSASASSTFVFDSNSSLTSSEQQEKWRRLTAQRRMAEERQRLETEQQQAKQQQIWEADEQRRKAAAKDAQSLKLSSSKEEEKSRDSREAQSGLRILKHDDRSKIRRTEKTDELVDLSNVANSPSMASFASATPISTAPAGQSLGQAMKSSRRAGVQPERKERNRTTLFRKISLDGPENDAANSGPPQASDRNSVRQPHKTQPRERRLRDGQKQRQSRESQQTFPHEKEQQRQKQPERVAMPDFMLPKESAAPAAAAAAAATTGWGARATEVKPLEYGDGPANVNIGEVNPNVQDISEAQLDDGQIALEDARAKKYVERTPGPLQRHLDLSAQNSEPASVEEDQHHAEDSGLPAGVQARKPSHASTLDSSGFYEEDATPETQGAEPISTPESGLANLPTIKRNGIAEAAIKAPTFGGWGRSPTITEEQSPSPSPEVSSSPESTSPAPSADPDTVVEQVVETLRAPIDVPAAESAPSAPSTVLTDASVEQSAEPSPNAITLSAAAAGVASTPPPAAPAPVVSTPPPPPPVEGLSEKDEMIERMRRMIEEYDRTKTLKTGAPASTPAPPDAQIKQPAPVRPSAPTQTRPFGLGAMPTLAKDAGPAQRSATYNFTPRPVSSPPAPPNVVQKSFANFKLPPTQHKIGDTGYRATPFNPDELLETSRAPAEEAAGKWGLLRRQDQAKAAPTPPPFAQTPLSPPLPQSQPQRQPPRIREEDADKLFEAHRASRTSYAPPASTRSHNESYVFNTQVSSQDLANKTCGRCGQIGHTAAMCRGPPRREPFKCNNCGTEGHMARDCPEPRKAQPTTYKVFVGGVHPEAKAQDFIQYFSRFEGVVHSRLMIDSQSATPGRSRGFGFVNFSSEAAMERFIADGPYSLLGKKMVINRDHGSARGGADPKFASSTAAQRSDNTRIANPFGSDAGEVESGGNGNVVRNTFRENRQPRRTIDSAAVVAPRFSQHEGEDDGEKRRGFRQAEPSSAPAVEEPRRGGREARRRQWEEPEAEVERSDRGAERKGRRGSRREMEEDEEDEEGGAREAHRARKAARQRQKDAEKDAERQAAKRQRELRKKEAGTAITLPEFISVQHLSQALGVRYEAFVERLEELGYDDIFAGKTLDSETSGMIAMEYNFDPTFDGGYREEEIRDLKARPPLADKESLPTRPPVVTIMGHVDHGKTTLLDYLRKSSVAAGEAGGITQHIGAFSVPLTASGKTVTFLDTPGHAAFLAMRQRGANVTDMVILVVAADDSVKPQTLEAIKHAKEAGVPMIVALNKVDKPEADVERCKQDLARHGVEIEDYGGDVQVVEVSGKTGKGMDALEENVVALSELLDHRAETDGAVEGWILEATTRKAGRVATVLVRRGTLAPGTVIVAGKTWARIRTLKNEAGVEIEKAGPGMPCEVDGWRDQPNAGDEVLEAPTEQKAGSVVEFRIELAEREQTKKDMEIINANRKLEQDRREKEKAAEQAAKRAAAAAAATVGPDGQPVSAPVVDATLAPAMETEAEKESGPMTVPFIIKADVSGSAEAVAAYILSISNPFIAPTILASGVGSVHESDIERAAAAQGHIIAFNLPADPEAMGNATARGVKILANDIIYRCLDDVKAVLEEKLPPIITSRVTGEAEISTVFQIGVGGRKKISIAGVKVRNGSVPRNARVRVMRGGEKVYDGTITSLKNQKKDADVMRKGSECGMGFEDWEAFESGDQVQVYEEISERRRL